MTQPGFGRGALVGAGTAVGLWVVYLVVSSSVLDTLMWDTTVVPVIWVLVIAAVVVAVAKRRLRRAAIGFAVMLPVASLATFVLISVVAVLFFGI